MIAFLLLSVIQLTIATVPMIREQNPMIMSLDGIEELLYEIPEYEEYELSLMNGSPILSLLQMAKKQSEHKDKYIAPKEKFALAKESLDDIITRLQTIRSRLENGNGNIHYSDIEKSIDGLKKLERSFRPDISHILSAMRQTMSISKPAVKSEILEVRTITRRPTEMPVTTGKPIFPLEVLSIDVPEPVAQPVRTAEPAPVVEPAATEEPTVEPVRTGEPVAPTTEEAEESMKPPYAMEVYKSQKEFKVEDDDVKRAYPSRWTWKSSSFV